MTQTPPWRGLEHPWGAANAPRHAADRHCDRRGCPGAAQSRGPGPPWPPCRQSPHQRSGTTG
eukprot:9289341-Alexandrium_andersonii.AAC.1